VLARLLGCSVILRSATASADSSIADKAAAEALFDRGVTLLRTGDYKQACAKLEASERIDPAVGTLLYLGTCYERLGRTASAWATFREASSLAQSTGQTDRAEIARGRAARLEADLAYLTIVVPAAAHLPELVVRRAGSVIGADAYGVPLPTDPGGVSIEASSPGYNPFVATVTLAVRDHRTLTIPELVKKPESSAPAPSSPDAQRLGQKPTDPVPVAPLTPAEPGPSASRVAAYSLGALGIVGIGVGSYFGIKAIQQNRAAKDQHQCSGDTCPDRQGLASTDDALNAARVSSVAFAAGGGLLALGIVVYVLSPNQSAARLALSPRAGRNSAGLCLGGQFQ
jgi:hypothetical protein